MKMKQHLTLPRLVDGRDVRFQDDYDGMHAYIDMGDCEVRYAVPDDFADALRTAECTGSELADWQLKLTPAKIPAAAHVLERNQAKERKRLERTFYRKHRRFRGLPIDIDWSSATPHTGAPEINRSVAVITVGVGGTHQFFEWDGEAFTAVDPQKRLQRCGCPECMETLGMLGSHQFATR